MKRTYTKTVQRSKILCTRLSENIALTKVERFLLSNFDPSITWELVLIEICRIWSFSTIRLLQICIKILRKDIEMLKFEEGWDKLCAKNCF